MAGTATKDGLLAWLGQQDTEEAKSLVQLWGQVSGRCPQPTARAVAKELGTNLREGDGGKTDNFKQLSVLVEELRCRMFCMHRVAKGLGIRIFPASRGRCDGQTQSSCAGARGTT